ncbi:hypothetical protein M3Y97_00790500 [Aphelenchoides bicaudatus]|nr:hypothetical protein M3Y97_00790500 [Aphelenchoides bicaudatus]
MDNDERLFFVLVSLMRLSKRIELPYFLNPLHLSLMLLCEVNFSETTFVDWLCSESVATIFSLQFFKLLHSEFEQLSNLFLHINQLMQSTKTSRRPVDCSVNKELVTTFNITELHGKEIIKKRYPVFIRTNESSNQVQQTNTNKTFTLEDLIGFVSRLYTKLENLNNKELMSFNVAPLLRVIKAVDTLTD